MHTHMQPTSLYRQTLAEAPLLSVIVTVLHEGKHHTNQVSALPEAISATKAVQASKTWRRLRYVV